MKLNKEALKRIIKEEMRKVIKESAWEDLPDGYGGVPQRDPIEKAKKDFKEWGYLPKHRMMVVKRLRQAMGEKEADEWIREYEYVDWDQRIKALNLIPEEEEFVVFYLKNRNSRSYWAKAEDEWTSTFGDRAKEIKTKLFKRDQ